LPKFAATKREKLFRGSSQIHPERVMDSCLLSAVAQLGKHPQRIREKTAMLLSSLENTTLQINTIEL